MRKNQKRGWEIKIFVEHLIGDIVYLKTDCEQYGRIVVGYEISENEIIYILTLGSDIYKAFPVEITRKPNEMLKLGIEVKNN